MSNINDATFLQGMIDAAKVKKDESLAVVNDHSTNSQAAIDSARAEIARLETDIGGFETQIEDFNAKLADPPTIDVAKGGKAGGTTTIVDANEVTKIETDKAASQVLLDAANVDVAAAQAEAAEAEAILAAGPETLSPDYAQAHKMFGLLGHLDKLIALKTAGQAVSDAALDTFKNNMTHLGTELQEEMGSEFVTKFWTDVEAGLITLKELGTVVVGPTPDPTPDPTDETVAAKADLAAFFDTAVSDPSSTERSQLNSANELLLDKLLENTLGGSEVGDVYGDQSLPGLLDELAEVFGDRYIYIDDGDVDLGPGGVLPNTNHLEIFGGQTKDIQTILEAAGFDTGDSSALVTQEVLELIIENLNKNSDQGLLLGDEVYSGKADQLTALNEGATDLQSRIDAVNNGTSTEDLAALTAQLEKQNDAIAIINKYNKGADPAGTAPPTEVLDYLNTSATENTAALATATESLADLEAAFSANPTATTLQELKDARDEVLVRTTEENFWTRVQESSILAEQAGNTNLLALLTEMNTSFDLTDETGAVRADTAQTRSAAYEILFPSNHAEDVQGYEELAFSDFKQEFYGSQTVGLENLRDTWTLEKEIAQFPQIAQGTIDTINKQLDVVNEAQSFWTERGDFWVSFAKQEASVTNEDAVNKLRFYASAIQGNENIADNWLDVDSDEAATQLAEAKANIKDYETRINNIFENGNEGFTGPESERGIYDYLDSALLPENIATEGPKVDALNKLLAQKLMEATLGGTDTGDILLDYSMPLLLEDIAAIFGDSKIIYETREPGSLMMTMIQSDEYSGFTGELQAFLEHKLYDTNNENKALQPEELVALIDVINDYTGNVTYLSDESRQGITGALANLDEVEFALRTNYIEGLAIHGNPTLPELLNDIANILGDTGVPGSTDPAEQFTGLTGAIAKGLAEFDIYDTTTPASTDEIKTILSNIQDVKTLFNDQNITNVNVDRTPRASNVFFYADEALDGAILDRKSALETIDDLDSRIAEVRTGESEEDLAALVLEKNKYLSFIEFTKASEEFWSYEKAFSYTEQNAEAALALYEQMRAQEEDFTIATLGEVGVANSLSIADYGDKIEAINTLRDGLVNFRDGATVAYSSPIPNPGFIEEASYASFKAETFAQQSEGLEALQLEYEDALVNGHATLSPAELQRELSRVVLQKSIVDFTAAFWAEENEFYQGLFTLDISNDKANLLNVYLNQLSDLQRDVEGWMGQLSSNNQSGRVARTKITRGRQQLAGLKSQILALSS